MSFATFHSRNLDEAREFEDSSVAVFGSGAVGSWVAVILGSAGANLMVVDRDRLEPENLHRHALTRSSLYRPKALSLAWSLRRELPRKQAIWGVQADLETLTDDQLIRLLYVMAPDVVVAATGNDSIDERLDLVAKALSIQIVIPGLFPPRNHEYLGEVWVSPWAEEASVECCFRCSHIRPQGEPHDAMPGALEDVLVLASITAEIVKGLLLPASPLGRLYITRLDQGRQRFLVGRYTKQIHAARQEIPNLRPHCPACGS